jgi:hypothetical protein
MEDPIIPAATAALPAAHARRFAWLHNPSIRTLLLASGALFLLVVLVNVVMSFSSLKLAFLTHGTYVETVENGVPTWYKISFGTAKKVDGAPGFKKAPVTVLEAVSYGEEGTHVVLARVPGVEGIALGILHSNNTFENVLSDGTNKADLAVRPDGMALYAAMVDGESRLMLLELTNPEEAPTDLGRGKSPRVFTDGFFVAISEQGIVRIDPVADSVELLLPSSRALIQSGALSTDGTQVLVPGATSRLTLLGIKSTSPSNIAVVGETRIPSVADVFFSTTNKFVIVSGTFNSLRVYSSEVEATLLGVLPVT